jgi:hypothetical protein
VDAPGDTPAEADPAAGEMARDEAVAVAGAADGRPAERAGSPGLEPRRDAVRVVHVLARRDGRGRTGLQLLHAHGAVAPRSADRDGGQGRGGPGTGLRVAGVQERAGVHDADDALERGGGGAAAGAAGDGLAALGAWSTEAAACVAPERRLHAAGGARHRQRQAI